MKKEHLIIIFLLFIVFQKSYISFLPSLPVYPNSYRESLIVLEEMKKDQSLFYLTDESVGVAFVDILPVPPEEIDRIMRSQNYIILFFKYLINRARPEQVNPQIVPLKSTTADTPAYPSGHSYQAFLLAHHFSQRFPHLREQLYTVAEQCGQARIRAGLHYPSDHEFSKKLVHIINGRGQVEPNKPYRSYG